MTDLTTISLYTGAGGLDLGLEAAGFRNAIAVENEPIALETLSANHSRWGFILGEDIHELLGAEPQAKRILRAAGLEPGQASLLAGGPPCQPFSKSGYWARGDAARLEDPRARTLEAYLDVLEFTLPEAYLLENVPGISFSDKDEGLAYVEKRIGEINARVDGADYSFRAAKLNAAEYGVPQLRERVFVIGHRKGKMFKFPQDPTHVLPPRVSMADGMQPFLDDYAPADRVPAACAWDALADIQIQRTTTPAASSSRVANGHQSWPRSPKGLTTCGTHDAVGATATSGDGELATGPCS